MFGNNQYGTIHLLCGRICSGKSTFAKQLHEETNGIILSCDDLMLTLFNQHLGETHDILLIRCKQYLYSLAVQIAKSNIDVILDFGFWKKSEREEVKMFFNSLDIPTKLHYINPPKDKISQYIEQKNSQELGYIVDDNLLQKCNTQFEPPSIDEVL